MSYSIGQIKDELPDVPVLIAKGHCVKCRLVARKALFATVVLPSGGSIEVAWHTIQNVLNTGTAIRL